jgi:ATP-dependent protease HslVU (ClpYQ) peptidase subunit
MTICLAALCENSNSCVVAADRMAVFGQGSLLEFKQDNTSHKIHKLDERIILLHSGATQDAEAIVSRFRKDGPSPDARTWMDRVLTDLLREQRDLRIRRTVGGDFNYEKLLAAVTASPNGPFRELWDTVQKIDLGDMLLVAPTDGEYVIHYLRPPAFAAKSDLHYATVGSGGIYARAALTIQQYSHNCDLTVALFKVYSAKKAAELVYGVGEPTDMAILTQYGFKSVSDATLRQLESIRSDRESIILSRNHTSLLKASLGVADS